MDGRPVSAQDVDLLSEAGEGEGKARGPSQATRLVALALGAGAQPFHTPDGEAFISVPVAGHWETYSLKARAVDLWLRRLFHDACNGKAPGGQAVADALGVLRGKAQWDGPEQAVHTRIAPGPGGKVYLDLGRPDWDAVEIDADGWRVVAAPPVAFRRARGMLALPLPVRGGELRELHAFLNMSETDFRLVASALVNMYLPTGPYPVLVITGEQGSAKSTSGRVLRRLIDPNKADQRSEPRDARDLAIAARNSRVIALDNLSSMPVWLSDAMCRLSTGGGFSTRELYADEDETIFEAQRPVLLNSIEDLAARSDLLDRSIVVVQPRIPDEGRKTEADFWDEFEQARPRLLGAVLDAVSLVLREQDRIHLRDLPRMADFAKRACALSPALRWTADDFLAAYAAKRADAHELALSADVLSAPVSDFAREMREYVGTAGDLLRELAERVDDATTRRKDWPKSARALSSALRRLAPDLRAVGVTFDAGGREAGSGRRLVRLGLAEGDTAGTSSQPSQPSQPDSPGCDGCDERAAAAMQPSQASSHLPRFERDERDGCDGPSQLSPHGHIGAAPRPSPSASGASSRPVTCPECGEPMPANFVLCFACVDAGKRVAR